jgi:hypothetical protein
VTAWLQALFEILLCIWLASYDVPLYWAAAIKESQEHTSARQTDKSLRAPFDLSV